MKLWFVSQEQPASAWFHEMNFADEVRERVASAAAGGSSRIWGDFEANFFGPPLLALDALSRDYDIRLLDQQLTRGTPPDLMECEPIAP